MKKTLLLCVVFAMPQFAQYGPPARDLDEAQQFMRELQRQFEPALVDAKDRAAVFNVVTRAHNQLIGKKPAEEVSNAIGVIDDFLQRRERQGNELSRENLRTLQSVRKEFELAQPPYAILALHERLHHEFVHNLQRQVMKDMDAMEKLKQHWEFIATRMAVISREGTSGIAAAANEPGQ